MIPGVWCLVIGAAAAALTLNVYWPVRRWSVALLPSFFAGWLVAELAWHHLVSQLALAVFFVAAGALDSWTGQLGLGLLGASCLGLAHLGRAARLTLARFEDALGGRPDDELAPARGRAAVPFLLGDRRVRVERDIPYADEAGRRHTLDIYRPADHDPDRAPVLLWVHGGGWVVGNKRQQGQPLLNHMAARGWVCVAANYRLSPRTRFPGQIVDVKRALRWVRAHIEAYGGDPSFVAVSGGSAGAHLASLLALTAEARAFQPGFEDETLAVQACVPIYGVYDFADRDGHFPHGGLRRLLELAVMPRGHEADPEAWLQASPLSWVSPGAPPFCVVHGTHDNMAPVSQARGFVDALRARSKREVVYVEVPFAHHAYDVFHSPRTAATVRGIHAFLAATHARREDDAN